MPVRKVGSRYAIGSGKPIYRTRASAERAYRAYLARKHDKRKR